MSCCFLQVTVAFPSHARLLFPLLPIPFITPNGTGTPQEALSAVEARLRPLLNHPNLDGALQVLKEIGNLLAVLSLLDEAMVRAHSHPHVLDFLQLGP
jgi:hypothetical protein